MKKTFVIWVFMAIGGWAQLNAQVLLPAVLDQNTLLKPSNGYFYTTTSLSIPAGVTLKISEGVEIRMAASASIVVEGSLVAEGTEANPIVIKAAGKDKWNRINGISASVHLSHVQVRNAVQFAFANYGKIFLDHCSVDSTFGGVGADCIALHDADSVIMRYCELHGDPLKPRIDAVDCDAASYGVFSNNKISDFEDDGIDIGTNSSNITIDSNYIVNCNFGISVGEGSVAEAYRNSIACCDGAMQTHTHATIHANHNTFYKNLKGIECHHGSESGTPGDINIANTIFSQTLDTLYTLQAGSNLSITYSLSDNGILDTNSTNIFGDPRLVNPDSGNFTLKSCSPCINAGDPAESIDSCCFRADVGAWESHYAEADTNCLVPVSTEEVSSEQRITLFPVPVQNKLCLHSDAGMQAQTEIRVFNLAGILVYQQPLGRFNDCIPFDLPQGLYIITLHDDQRGTWFRQLIVHYL